MAVPPIRTQRAIAKFLHTETGRIDSLIEKKRQLTLALEGRAAAYSERELLGLHCQELVAARSRWFVAIPASWRETTLRHVGCEAQTGPFGSQLHAEEYVEDGWPMVNPANLVGGKITALGSMTISDEKRVELARHILRSGDIVVGRRGEMGRAGLVDEAQAGWLCGTGSLRLRLTGPALLPAYLKALLETMALREYFSLASVGSTMDNLSTDSLLSMPVLVPPTDEQRAIIHRVTATRIQADALGDRIRRQVGLLQEHRQALITDAVSGELEVPGVAA